MEISIREGFGGIGMGDHREDLVKRLDHIMPQISVREERERYEKLKEALVEVDREAKTLNRMSPGMIILLVR